MRRGTFNLWLAVVACSMVLAACNGESSGDDPIAGPAAQPAAQSSVPAQYQRSYDALATALDRFDERLKREWSGARFPVVHGANLFTANCHRGEDLLAANAVAGNGLVLDQFQRLGIQGVTIALSYPLAMPDFPSTEANRAAEYWAVYERIANEVRARGMKLNIESGVMFGVGGFTSLPVADYYLRLRGQADSVQRYTDGRVLVLTEIAKRLKPDYLSFGSEPDVAASLVGLPALADAAFNERFARTVVQAVKAASPGTAIGTGVGTWLPIGDDLIARYGRIEALDYIDLHVYPVQSGLLDRAIELARQARAAGKKIVLSEAWLFKDDQPLEGGGNVWADVLSRNVYSFWAPLDQRFHAALVKWAHAEKVDYIAPFSAISYFAYLPTDDQTLGLDIAGRNGRHAQLALEVILRNAADMNGAQFSSTGQAYQTLIRDGPR